MTIKLNLPSPRSVYFNVFLGAKDQAGNSVSPDDNYAFRLLTADGKLFTQLDEAQAIALFPAALSAFVASGKDRVALHDIPESLLNDVAAALRSAGWYVRIRSYPDFSANYVTDVPYTTMTYYAVPHLVWSSKPFPLTFEEKIWQWLKSWFV